MRLFGGVLVLSLFLGLMLAPLAVLLEFHVHRATIERELCVQRDVVDAMRTCHGECQLSKRFKALEKQADANFPSDRIELRLEPQVPVHAQGMNWIIDGTDRDFPAIHQRTLNGVRVPKDHVPRG